MVVSADTGQAFFEHGFAAHANKLYNEVMKVPLIIHEPASRPAFEDCPAQQIDVPPTIFHLLRLPQHPSFQGKNLFDPDLLQGRSLYLTVQTPIAYQYAVVRSGFKLIYDEKEGDYLLYDQIRDPQEQVDLATEYPEIVRKLGGGFTDGAGNRSIITPTRPDTARNTLPSWRIRVEIGTRYSSMRQCLPYHDLC